MYKGGCLYGAVGYVLKQEINELYFCHCSRCRKASGSAFSAVAVINTSQLSILSGTEDIKRYNSSDGVGRYFCQCCGSPLFSRRDNEPERSRLRVGTIDTDFTIQMITHIYTESKADWYDICDNHRQFEQRP